VSSSSSRRISPLLLCAIGEFCILVGVFLLAVLTRFLGPPTGPLSHPQILWTEALVTASVIVACLYYADLYEHEGLRRRVDLFIRLVGTFAGATLLLTAFFFAIPRLEVGRGVLVIYLPLALVAIFIWRVFFVWAWDNEALSERVMILGTGQIAQSLAREMLERSPVGFRVLGFLSPRSDEVGTKLVAPLVIGVVDEVERFAASSNATLILVAQDDLRGHLPIDALLRCRLRGVRVEEANGFYERLTGRILVRDLRPSSLVFSDGFVRPRLLYSIKRFSEVIAAAIMIAVAAPLMAIIALLVRIDGPGPVLYRQRRVGEGGRVFNLLKFRSMKVSAELSSGPVWSSPRGDPRVTRLGRFLRKVRFDELPQLINVLRGEMSFVGPRPERPEFVELLAPVIPYYDERHTVYPGITGWAQINFPYGSTLEDAEEKLEYDLYYLKHMSLMLDFVIVMKTLRVMMLGRGAR
jgi:sugar transferase (PEP-CTERM system associated)